MDCMEKEHGWSLLLNLKNPSLSDEIDLLDYLFESHFRENADQMPKCTLELLLIGLQASEIARELDAYLALSDEKLKADALDRLLGSVEINPGTGLTVFASLLSFVESALEEKYSQTKA